ncbi:hypothetical protein [Saccharopolyspora sp. NPDC002686]|uniref:hypothetical protein n=1 Tax=Saccharopolyspora sp. NPDC002686 TaxID=3154541 RepID=UPI003330B786
MSPLDSHITQCPDCRASIVWATTGKGHQMPLDAEPVPAGNVLLSADRKGVHAGVLGPNQAAGARDRDQPLYQHHRLSCPYAHKWARHR